MPVTIESLINGYGQLNYHALKDFVSENSLADFTAQTPHPFLVGKALYEGELKKKIGGTLSNTSTMKFNVADLRIPPDSETVDTATEQDSFDYGKNKELKKQKDKDDITHYVYVLRKKSHSISDADNIISIGRNGMNDIVLTDSVISNKHAQIIITNGMYFIADLNSTNGTKVNLKPVIPGSRVQLQLNATIDFGRVGFIFAHPLQLYRFIRKELLF